MDATPTVERLLTAEEVRVSILTLRQGEAVPPHRHSEVSDFMVVLEGRLRIVRDDGIPTVTLSPGESCMIPPGVEHTTVNDEVEKCRFLLVQHGGHYDFRRSDPI